MLPSHGLRSGRLFTDGRPLRRRAADAGPLRPTGRLHAHRRRRRGRRRARGRGQLVPGERPPQRQGVVLHARDGTHRPDGRLQRLAARHHLPRRADDLELGRDGTDGVLPGHGHHRAVPTCTGTGRTAAGCTTRSTPTWTSRSRLPAPATQFVLSSQADSSYQRLARTLAVPAAGAQLSFWLTRDTEQDWDFVFVEAHTVGQDDWTTLPDVNGHTDPSTGKPVPTAGSRSTRSSRTTRPSRRDGTCSPHGQHRQLVGRDRGQRRPGALAGRPRRPTRAARSRSSLAYASDQSFQRSGVAVDDVAVVHRRRARRPSRTTATRSTAGRSPGAPAGQPGQRRRLDRRHGRRRSRTHRRHRAEARSRASPRSSPSSSAHLRAVPVLRPPAGSSTTCRRLGFALENQTRPIYARVFFSDRIAPATSSSSTSSPTSGTATRLGPQLAGHLAQRGLRDVRRVAVERARGRRPGRRTIFDCAYDGIPPDDSVLAASSIGDPGRRPALRRPSTCAAR